MAMRFIKNFISLFSGSPKVSKKKASDETISLILNRRSCRMFNDSEISTDDQRIILEAGRFAPSTVNLQTWSFITFTKTDWRDVFSRPIPFRGTFAVIICADTYRLNDYFPDFAETPFVNHSFAVFNAGLAAMNMTIAAEALGMKSIMLSETGKAGLLDYTYLKDKLNLPAGVLPLTTLVLGRSDVKLPGIPPRQPFKSVVMEKRYNHSAAENLKDWFQQMFIGFKLTHPFSNFERQIEFYKDKMTEAEADIKKSFLDVNKIK